MRYHVTGEFIEACDCTIICPCWVDEDPLQGSCTGLVAWQLARGSWVNDTKVGGLRVVSVSTHGGNRRKAETATVIFIDHGATPQQYTALKAAFTGTAEGPLGALAAVTGTVLAAQQAHVGIERARDGSWSVRIRPLDRAETTVVQADGRPKVFSDQPDPLLLRHTALTQELGITPSDDVTAQSGGTFHVNVGRLPGVNIDVDSRSGMSGNFEYTHGTAATAGTTAS